ncbi:DUF305 domain-containing protein [Streptomyces katsurahamanus]|uniref:DUF305 domain-containing protein n=1 Tax=Streptomyces katsurahamanus TaxID=2577098 RepID=UPI003899B538
MLYRPTTRGVRRAVTAAAVAVAVLALGACQSDSGGPAKAEAGASASVVAPGKPGEPAKTLSAEEAQKALPDDSPNAADLRYARMMIAHHSQALTMTGLAPDRAGSTQVKRLAERISAGQKPEIGAMEGWLKINGKDTPKSGQDHGDHGDHGGDNPGDDKESMPGMATKAQLKKLRAAQGKAFDELFLKLMITHHEGAITMATEVLTEGNNVRVEEMAGDVVAGQTTEINRMRDM